MNEIRTLGKVISSARKAKKLSLQALARLIKKPDGTPISDSYLHSIEMGAKCPRIDYLLTALAYRLNLSESYLFYLAGLMPPRIRNANVTSDQIDSWVNEFLMSNVISKNTNSKMTGDSTNAS